MKCTNVEWREKIGKYNKNGGKLKKKRGKVKTNTGKEDGDHFHTAVGRLALDSFTNSNKKWLCKKKYGVVTLLTAGTIIILLNMGGIERNPGPKIDRTPPPPKPGTINRFFEQTNIRLTASNPELNEIGIGPNLKRGRNEIDTPEIDTTEVETPVKALERLIAGLYLKLDNHMKEMSNKMDVITDNINVELSECKATLKDQAKKISDLERLRNEDREAITNLHKIVDTQYKSDNKANIVIHEHNISVINLTEEDKKQKVQHLISKNLGVQVRVSNVTVLGKVTEDNTQPPIKITIPDNEQREMVWKNVSKLAGTKLSFRHDTTKHERMIAAAKRRAKKFGNTSDTQYSQKRAAGNNYSVSKDTIQINENRFVDSMKDHTKP